MLRPALIAAVLVMLSGCEPPCRLPDGGSGSDRVAMTPKQKKALAEWRSEGDWRGWADDDAREEFWVRMEPKTGLPDYLQSPAFVRVVREFDLGGKPLDEFVRVLGEPDAASAVPLDGAWYFEVIDRAARVTALRGWPYWWKGSVAFVKPGGVRRPERAQIGPNARVLAVSEKLGRVMLAAGLGQRARGSLWLVRRGGVPVCSVRVVGIHDDVASAEVLAEVIGKPGLPKPGDWAFPVHGPEGYGRARKAARGMIERIVYPQPDYGGPPILAKVLAVDGKAGTVTLSAGADHAVEKGYHFTVYRGDCYVGKVEVEAVEKEKCAARILPRDLKAGEKVRVGDNAATRVY